VVPVEDFERWIFGDENTPLPMQAQASTSEDDLPVNQALNALNEKFCLTCHSIDGSAAVGPSLKGLYGKRQIVVDRNGVEREIEVDDDYLVRAIQDPGAEDVKGYPSVMPAAPVSEDELREIINFIRSLSE